MNKKIILGITTTIGAGLGYAYYYFVGCKSGTCPISSNWLISTLYGAAIGFIAGFPTKKKKQIIIEANDETNKDF
jgi:hypothetical protein